MNVIKLFRKLIVLQNDKLVCLTELGRLPALPVKMKKGNVSNVARHRLGDTRER